MSGIEKQIKSIGGKVVNPKPKEYKPREVFGTHLQNAGLTGNQPQAYAGLPESPQLFVKKRKIKPVFELFRIPEDFVSNEDYWEQEFKRTRIDQRWVGDFFYGDDWESEAHDIATGWKGKTLEAGNRWGDFLEVGDYLVSQTIDGTTRVYGVKANTVADLFKTPKGGW